jgi:hypothetical protein
MKDLIDAGAQPYLRNEGRMTAFEKGFRRALEGMVDPQLYVLMPGYRNGHTAALEYLLRAPK